MQQNQHIAELGPLLAEAGIREVIICPGSRNAPLIQLFTADQIFRCHSIVDERSAGYVALGMSRQLQLPVVIVTTSGTAVMNLAPAVAEARHQKIPLIIITADRPSEPVPQFNNQIIDQDDPFKENAKSFIRLPWEVQEPADLEMLCRRISHVIHSSISFPNGPVHLNVPLREPLYEPLPEPLIPLSGLNFPLQPAGDTSPDLKMIPFQARILILAGMQAPDIEIHNVLQRLVSQRQVAVVAENIANLPCTDFISGPELLLLGAGPEERHLLEPDIVIAFGGQIVSKSMKLFIQGLESLEVIILEDDPAASLNTLAEAAADTSPEFANNYLKLWKELELRSLKRADRFFHEAEFCNLTSVRRIIDDIPAGSVLHLGNSSAIRNSQLLPMRLDITCYSNRGTSGIDGSVSAAVGAAMVSDDLHVLISGDLSFVYDSNALWNKDFPGNLRIVVINDAGGGIFRLLDGPDRMDFFEEFSVTHHPVSLEMLSGAFGRGFLRAGNMKDLEEMSARIFSDATGYSILEVDTSGSENSAIFKEFKKSIS